jgi:hypothetical protein
MRSEPQAEDSGCEASTLSWSAILMPATLSGTFQGGLVLTDELRVNLQEV